MENVNGFWDIIEISQEKVKECKSVEELLKLAKENGNKLTQDEAEAYLFEIIS